jgi:MFS family permease
VFGAVADRWGPGRVIVLGALLLAAGCALIVAIGVMSAAGAGAGSSSILIGTTAQHIPAERRSFAGGVINAGGSLVSSSSRC